MMVFFPGMILMLPRKLANEQLSANVLPHLFQALETGVRQVRHFFLTGENMDFLKRGVHLINHGARRGHRILFCLHSPDYHPAGDSALCVQRPLSWGATKPWKHCLFIPRRLGQRPRCGGGSISISSYFVQLLPTSSSAPGGIFAHMLVAFLNGVMIYYSITGSVKSVPMSLQ